MKRRNKSSAGRGVGGNAGNKRLRNDNSTDFVDDVFDETRLLDVNTDICALCKQGHQFGLLLKRHLVDCIEKHTDHLDDLATEEEKMKWMDYEGVWVSRYGLGKGPRAKFVHYFCAATCPQVWFTGTKWKNVSKEIKRGSSFECSDCHERGATIGCYEKSCRVVMHLPCALKNGFIYSRFNANNFMCLKHRNEIIKQDLKKDLKFASSFDQFEITNGKEKIPLYYENTIDELHPLKNEQGEPVFTYITSNIDSDEVAINERCIEDLPSCACDGLCDQVETCSCLSLSGGKNYSYKKTLLKGIGGSSNHNNPANQRIVECNLKCACSIRRCTNRVVSNGLTVKMKVFRNLDDPEQRWGVRLLEDVPANAFVCEINGQLQLLNELGNPQKFPILEEPSSSSSSSSAAAALTADELLSDSEVANKAVYCLDCSQFGNVSHFIRRRKVGRNLMLQKKLVYNTIRENASIPKIGLFAMRDLRAGEELFL